MLTRIRGESKSGSDHALQRAAVAFTSSPTGSPGKAAHLNVILEKSILTGSTALSLWQTLSQHLDAPSTWPVLVTFAEKVAQLDESAESSRIVTELGIGAGCALRDEDQWFTEAVQVLSRLSQQAKRWHRMPMALRVDAGSLLLRARERVSKGSLVWLDIVWLCTAIVRGYGECNGASVEDADAFEAIVLMICSVSDAAGEADILGACIAFFAVVVKVGMPAPSAVSPMLASVCRALNVQQFATPSWEVVRALLAQRQYAHRGILALCALLRDRAYADAVHVRRGSVFCLGMACWGSKRLSSLRVPHATLLPALTTAIDVEPRSAIVAYEIALAVRRLIRKFGVELSYEWDYVLELVLKLASFADRPLAEKDAFAAILQDMLRDMDAYRSAGHRVGAPHLWTMVSTHLLSLTGGVRAALHLSPEAVSPPDVDADGSNFVVNDVPAALCPTHVNWPHPLQRVVAATWAVGTATTRREAIDVFARMYDAHKYLFEVELLDKLVIPVLESCLMQETDADVAERGFDWIADVFADVTSNRMFDVCNILVDGACGSPQATLCATTLVVLLQAKFSRPPATHSRTLIDALCTVCQNAKSGDAQRVALRLLGRVHADERFRLNLDGRRSPYLRCHARRSGDSDTTAVPIAGRRNSNAWITEGGLGSTDDDDVVSTDNVLNALLVPLESERREMDSTVDAAVDGLVSALSNTYIALSMPLGRAVDVLCSWLWHPAAVLRRHRPPAQWLLGITALRFLSSHANRLSHEQGERLLVAIVRGVKSAPMHTLQLACVDAVTQCVLELPTKTLENHYSAIIAAVAVVPRTQEAFLRTLKLCNVIVESNPSLDPVTQEAAMRYVLHFCDPNKSNVASFAFEVLGRWVMMVPQIIRAQQLGFVVEAIHSLAERGCSLAEAHLELFSRCLQSNTRAALYPTPFSSVLLSAEDQSPTEHWAFGNAIVSVRSGVAGFVQMHRRSPCGVDSLILRHFAHEPQEMVAPLTPEQPPMSFAPAVQKDTPSPSLAPRASVSVSSKSGSVSQVLATPHLVKPPWHKGRNDPLTMDGTLDVPESPEMFVFNYAPLPSYDGDDHEDDDQEDMPLWRSQDVLDALQNAASPPLYSQASSTEAHLQLHSVASSLSPSPRSSLSVLSSSPLFLRRATSQGSDMMLPLDAAARPVVDRSALKQHLEREQSQKSVDAQMPHEAMVLLRQYPFRHKQPIRLPNNAATQRALDYLDHTLSVTTHKFGVVYVGPGQTTLREALTNAAGSTRYNAFLHGLGRFEKLKGVDERARYTGGLTAGIDGEHGLFSSDHFSFVVYHVCTMMPSRKNDPDSANKVRHIGNDYVNIFFSANAAPFPRTEAFPGASNFVTILVYPQRLGLYRIVTLEREPGVLLPFGGTEQGFVVSHAALTPMLRNLAIAADHAAARHVDGRDRRIANVEVRMTQIQSLFAQHQEESEISGESTTKRPTGRSSSLGV